MPFEPTKNPETAAAELHYMRHRAQMKASRWPSRAAHFKDGVSHTIHIVHFEMLLMHIFKEVYKGKFYIGIPSTHIVKLTDF